MFTAKQVSEAVTFYARGIGPPALLKQAKKPPKAPNAPQKAPPFWRFGSLLALWGCGRSFSK